ncbi:sterol desaturase family protein [Lichenihabitans sp. Uapishka_5]|uniref:sterol desaturase family protein n=1 Tax=Lichenihabitans sp. Uapishka_5 TaxID=3037302 RepID=UPI0029E80617|nr:sterol desaturase family protein [Lichenihabitans sp. Uapishka_5]MDX7950455.1 sterol desaturase family protein [Lichenihabitans sp. Uapishka_5]
MGILGNSLVTAASFFAMEAVAWAGHKYIMHGLGWSLHRSHHEDHDGWFEINDLYGAGFGLLAVATFVWFAPLWPPLYWIAVGVTLYGVAYFVVHDGLVHQRWPFHHKPRHPYLKRLVQAHKLHHAVEGRTECVSFGFLYAPPVRRLKQHLVRLHAAGRRLRPEPGE